MSQPKEAPGDDKRKENSENILSLALITPLVQGSSDAAAGIRSYCRETILSAFLKSLLSPSLLRKRYYEDTFVTDRLRNGKSNSLKTGTSNERQGNKVLSFPSRVDINLHSFIHTFLMVHHTFYSYLPVL